MNRAVVGGDDEFTVSPSFMSADQKLQDELLEDVIVGILEMLLLFTIPGTQKHAKHGVPKER